MVSGVATALRVLLIEDSVLLAERIGELIRHLPDVDLMGVVDGEAAAIQRVADSKPDVLILDLHLRQGSGFGVLRSLYEARERPKVIVLTNHDVSAYRSAAELFGVAAFLDKARDYGRLPSLLLTLAQERASDAQPAPGN